MKASEIRKMSASELDTKLHDLKDELFKLRFQQAINQLDNPYRFPILGTFTLTWICESTFLGVKVASE